MKEVLNRFKNLFQTRDLTRGSIVKGLIVFMIPILLSIVFQQLFTLTDTIIVGQNLSPYEISGINDVGCLASMALQFIIGATSGFSVVISHKIGENNKDHVRKSFYLQMLICFLLTVVMTLGFCIFVDPLLSLLKITPSSIDANAQLLYQSAHDYLFVIYLGIYSSMAYNFLFANLRALGDSFTPFLFLVIGVLLNIALDMLFVVGLHWGVIGSAWATVISQSVSSILCAIYIFKKYDFLHYKKGDLSSSRGFVVNHLKLGLPLGLQASILEIGIIIMQVGLISFDYLPNGMLVSGTPAQVGYSIACKLNFIIMNVYMAIGTAMLTYTGQNYGSRNTERIRKGILYGSLIGAVAFVILTLFGMLLTINGFYMYIFLKPENISQETIRYGNYYLWLCVPCDLILMLLFLCRNVLQGLNRPLFPFLAGVSELVARILCCLFLPPAVNGGPINSEASMASYLALSLADPLAWIAATLIMIIPLLYIIFNKKKGIYRLSDE